MCDKTILTGKIKSKAKEIGFDACGISKAEPLIKEKGIFKNWLSNKYNADMHYMSNDPEKRLNPEMLMQGTKSVITLLLNYYPPEKQSPSTYQIAKYAYGKDYHTLIKNKLKILENFITEKVSEADTKAFTDSSPIMEKAWAVKSGMGWAGKNSVVINKDFGSFFFISEILTNIELEYNSPFTEDLCGNCTKCIDICPTNAITEPHVVDANRCISYLTIEHKGDIPDKFSEKFHDWIYGCDICQDVCPWNKNAKPHNITELLPGKDLLNMTKKEWEELTEEKFNIIFKDSAIKRAGYKNLKRNIWYC